MKIQIQTKLLVVLCMSISIKAMPLEMPADGGMPVETPAAVPTEATTTPVEMPAETAAPTETPAAAEATSVDTTMQETPAPAVENPGATTSENSGLAATPAPQAAATSTPQNVESEENPTVKLARTEIKQGLEKINQTLELISSSKTEMKTILSQADEAVEKAKQIVAQARKESLALLKQATDESAQKTSDSIKAQLDELTALSTKVTNEISPAMQKKIEAVKTQMAEVEKELEEARSKENALKATLALDEKNKEKKQAEKPIAGNQKSFKNWFVADQANKAQSAPVQDATFIHYALRRMADFVTSAARIVHATFITIKNMISPSEKKSEGSASGAQQNEAAPQTPNMQVAGNSPATSLNTGALTDAHEKKLNDLIQARGGLYKNYTTVETSLLLLVQNLKTISDAYIHLPALIKLESSVAPEWKKSAEQTFSSFLDYITVIYKTVYSATYNLYAATIKPFITTFSHDVKKNLER